MIRRYSKDITRSHPVQYKQNRAHRIYGLRLLPWLCTLSLVLIPFSFADNPQPWGEQEAERNAQEEVTNEEKSAQEEMSSSLYGRITNLDRDARVLSLLPTDDVENKEAEEDNQVASQDFRFKSDTPLTGIDSLSELSVGDYVTLDYYAFVDGNRIRGIVFDKHGENQENTSGTQGDSSGELIG